MVKPIIAFDLGGVIIDRLDSSIIENSNEILKELSKDYEIIFISKCKESRRLKSEQWLSEHGLDEFKRFYCIEYEEKVTIASKNNAIAIIDDKIQVLSKFGPNTLKIWYCVDEKRLEGTKKHQPNLYESLKIVTSWNQIPIILKENI